MRAQIKNQIVVMATESRDRRTRFGRQMDTQSHFGLQTDSRKSGQAVGQSLGTVSSAYFVARTTKRLNTRAPKSEFVPTDRITSGEAVLRCR
jgi:hypothetical protein